MWRSKVRYLFKNTSNRVNLVTKGIELITSFKPCNDIFHKKALLQLQWLKHAELFKLIVHLLLTALYFTISLSSCLKLALLILEPSSPGLDSTLGNL